MNALKHAFPESKPDAAIVVSYKIAETDWKLTISDNGIGKPDVKASESKGALGTSLIQALAKQLDSVVDISSDCPRNRSVHDTRDVQSQTTPGE